MSTPIFALTQLTEPSTYANAAPPPAPFSTSVAALMAECCLLTYEQFQDPGGTLSLPAGYSMITSLTTPENIAADLGTGGYYVTVPAGFVLTNNVCNIIALRGTQTLREWLDDVDVLPTRWLEGDNNGAGFDLGLLGADAPFGLVHSGFYGYYNLGTNGAVPQPTTTAPFTYTYSRPAGSLAAQIAALPSFSTFNPALPLYVTGHSLGAAVAVLCAMDVATNLSLGLITNGATVSLYGLACPNVAAGAAGEGGILSGISYPSSTFANAFAAAVPDSWLFANSCDIIPILPPPSTVLGGLVDLEFQPATPNIISFCSQSGSVSENHSCADIYVPYIQLLAAGFPQVKAHSAGQ